MYMSAPAANEGDASNSCWCVVT